jgi:hypothetical protein
VKHAALLLVEIQEESLRFRIKTSVPVKFCLPVYTTFGDCQTFVSQHEHHLYDVSVFQCLDLITERFLLV